MAMNVVLTAFAIHAVVCTASDLVFARNSTNRIIGGVTAQKGDFPYAVSLQLSRQAKHFCTGSLLDAKTVLTAAHCVDLSAYGLGASDVVVRAGSLVSLPCSLMILSSQSDPSQSHLSGGVMVKVSSMTAHPSYTEDNIACNVGIVKLQKPIDAGHGIGFATLAAAGSDPIAGTMATAAGW